ncbi:MAG: alternative ribosome rescue aminoacyl-tRNA hydrolase ArfB [Chitinophagales bacterium]|nr:aminoacyl-tRNA hydrolase [Chitinophagales bacterium]MDW8273987.1 alternative ribosome rescue aminoacyl-tRNA hydrolase ArfB [Chitinophagales bacterium]
MSDKITKTPFGKVPLKQLVSEFTFKYSRSSGPGGQHVNKVNTKVTAAFMPANSVKLTEEEKELLQKKLSRKIDKDGYITATDDSTRSQYTNRERAVKKLLELLAKAFTPKKERIATAATAASKHERVKAKRLHSEKKQMRKISLTDLL